MLKQKDRAGSRFEEKSSRSSSDLGFDRRSIDPDLIGLDPDRVQSQRTAGPTEGYPAIAQVERCGVTRAEQPSSRYMAKTEIGLFVRAGPLAGGDAAFVPDQDQI